MRVAIIGLGNVAQREYLPLLAASEDLEVYLHSRSSAKLQRIRRQYRLEHAGTDLQELIHWHPQAVFILTPPPTHFLLAKQFLLAGADVFVEKPVTLRCQDTEELARLAEHHQAILMVGFNRRFAPLVVKAQNVWADRPVNLAVFEKHRSRAYHPNLFENFLDDTVHMVDLLRFLCGEAQVIQSTSQVRDGEFIGGMSLLSLERGGSAIVAASLSAGRWTERFTLHGRGASLYAEAFSHLRLVASDTEQVWMETSAYTSSSMIEIRGIGGEVAHFFECVKNRQQPLTSAWDSLKTQLLIEDMARRARSV